MIMAKAIKSWKSDILGWTWHAKEKTPDGEWFGYVEGIANEWGHFTNDDLEKASAYEIPYGDLPE